VLRAGSATLWLALAVLLVRGAPRRAAAWPFLPLALGIAGFMARNTPDAALLLSGPAAVAASFLSGNAAVFLWWFALALFDDEFRLDAPKLAVGGLWVAVAALDRGLLGARFTDLGLSWVSVALGLGMVGHLGWRLLRDLEGDLVEGRRRARVATAAGLGLLLLFDLGIDIALGFDWKPRWFTMVQNGSALGLALVLGAWLLRVEGDAFPRPAAAPPVLPLNSAPAVDPAAGPLLARLHRLMEVERVYRDPDLTVSRFAALMGAPEPEVRRLVNQQLGHRHFRSFLNAWRVADVRASLADPARAGEKLVGIALDAGFASLASFNRAFKALEGRAPSEHRQAVQRGEIGF
jgi:AraC-like DNA-binding protein